MKDPNSMVDKKRGTGRTTRMLQHAIELDKDGRSVYIIAANKQHARALYDALKKLLTENSNYQSRIALLVDDIKIETPEALGSFDWERMQLRGAHPNCITLVDHYTIESRFHLMLKMLVAYDAPLADK